METDYLTSASKALLEDAGWRYFEYSSTEDFRRLWELDTTATAGGSAPARIAIDWNGAPPGPPGFPGAADFVTPIDWVLGHAYATQGQGEAAPFEVLVVDRRPRIPVASFADEFRVALTDALPEVKVFSAFGGSARDFVALQNELRAPNAIVLPRQEANDRDSSARPPASRHSPARLAALRNAWLSYTVRSQDHHDLSNLLGPLALGEAPGGDAADGASAVRAALYTMVEWLQLCEDRPNEHGASWIVGTAYERLADTAPIDAILVDDQAELGWARVVAGALGMAEQPSALSGGGAAATAPHGKDRLYYTTSPDDLLTLLKNCLEPHNPFARRLPLSAGAEDQVLFLDLRLFPRRGPDERQFYTKLCREILDARLEPRWQHDDHFSSVALTDRDRKILETVVKQPETRLQADRGGTGPAFLRCVSAILEDERISWQRIAASSLYDHLLTLLPRYVAQLLFTTPIVLFSATGRRDLVEHFREYGNIITSFEKPHLPLSFASTVRGFRAAMDAAAQILNARRALRAIAPRVAPRSPFGDNNGHYLVELFIDEAFPEGGEVQDYCATGGFWAVFQGSSREEALEKSARFDDSLVEHGFSYLTREPMLPALPNGKGVKAKSELAAPELKAALMARATAPISFGAMRLPYDDRATVDRRNSSGDDAYRFSLSNVVEFFLCEVMPHAVRGTDPRNFSISIYAATRVRGETEAAGVKELQYRYGFNQFRTPDGEYRLESSSRSTLFPIVDEIAAFRKVPFEIARAIAARLSYDKDLRGNPDFSEEGWCVCRKCSHLTQIRVRDEPMGLPEPPEGFDLLRVLREPHEEPTRRAVAGLAEFASRIRGDEINRLTGRSVVPLDDWEAKRLAVQKGDYLLAKLRSKIKRETSQQLFIAGQLSKVEVGKGTIRKIRLARSKEQLACQTCGELDSLRPDLPGGLYIADNALKRNREGGFPHPNYSKFLHLGDLGFDETWTDQLRDLRDAGRARDTGDRVQAARLATRALRAAPQLIGRPLPARVLGRLKPDIGEMTGKQFQAFAVGLALEDAPTQRPATCDGESLAVEPSDCQALVPDAEVAAAAVVESRQSFAERRGPQPLAAASSGECVLVLSGFAFVNAKSVTRVEAEGAVCDAVRGALQSAGLHLPSRVVGRRNSAGTGFVCEVECDDGVAEWLRKNADPERAIREPWWGKVHVR